MVINDIWDYSHAWSMNGIKVKTMMTKIVPLSSVHSYALTGIRSYIVTGNCGRLFYINHEDQIKETMW